MKPFEECTQKELEIEAFNLIASGQMFLAHDFAQKGFEKFPKNIRLQEAYALVLLKTGADREAKDLVLPLLGDIIEEEDINITSLRESAFVKSGAGQSLAGIGRIFKESWPYSRACQDLDIARELYLASFRKEKRTELGMNAAWLSWLTGEEEQSRVLAEEVLKLLPPMGLKASFPELVDLAEAQLLLGRVEEACRMYEEAMKQPLENYIQVVTARQQLLFLREAGFRVPEEALNALKPPAIVVFTGHMIDAPHLPVPIFPPELEEPVKQAINEKLEEIGATIGYSSAACGADLLFIEAILRRGGEVNLVLPFAIEDFIQTNVRHAGPRWEKRFLRALKKARVVDISAEERYLGHDMLFRFSNTVMHGTAVMRGQFLTSEPHLVAIWDSTIQSFPGGPSDFIDSWTNIETLHLVDLMDLRPPRELSAEAEKRHNEVRAFTCFTAQYDPFMSHAPGRVIKTMMFSDLSGYSKLQDVHIPAFLNFLQELHVAMEEIDLPIDSINTWGDAVFVVGDTASTIAEVGLRYCDIVETLGKKYSEFPFPIRARISLHAGPVYEAIDPFIKKKNYYGGHINRGARLEPVTTVGQVYATHQFVSIFHVEQNGLRHECEQNGIRFQEKYITEHVGVITLAKSFGNQDVYHFRRRQ
ncbi:MAG: hypothetical protein LBD66_02570 [Holosporales bacterium]|jgi:tetratricopeptide (TPR) repeat protein/class 3 adenylate cyclase|nr:hypothetical protein [Holosporales bacterium]